MLTPPETTRRHFLATNALAGLAITDPAGREPAAEVESRLAQVAQRPVLNVSFLKRPVIVSSVELLRTGSVYLIRARSRDGVEAVSIPHPSKMAILYPVFLKHIAPFFIGKDARELEHLLWELYRHSSNYKMQGLALWVCVAAIEMALLELLGQTAQRPLADFFGGAVRRDIPVYVASSNRGNTPAAEIAHLKHIVEASGVRALKFRLGGRMSRNADSLPGRTETLIAKVRESFGDSFTLYADANSSYDVREAIRIGRLLEAHAYAFYEEPCEFDDLWGTKAVTEALTIPVAGGEQEYSLHRWRWLIAHRAVDIVQPDLHYGGGLIRATQVARMATANGLTVVPHMSGGGLGYLDVIHYASFTPNIGNFMEFKGNTDLPVSCESSSLKCKNGIVRSPNGVGFGVTLDPTFIARATQISL